MQRKRVLSVNTKREQLSVHAASKELGRGNPIPEEVVKEYLSSPRNKQFKHRINPNPSFSAPVEMFNSFTTALSVSDGEENDLDSTPTIDALKMIGGKLASLVRFEFLVGDLDKLKR